MNQQELMEKKAAAREAWEAVWEAQAAYVADGEAEKARATLEMKRAALNRKIEELDAAILAMK